MLIKINGNLFTIQKGKANHGFWINPVDGVGRYEYFLGDESGNETEMDFYLQLRKTMLAVGIEIVEAED